MRMCILKIDLIFAQLKDACVAPVAKDSSARTKRYGMDSFTILPDTYVHSVQASSIGTLGQTIFKGENFFMHLKLSKLPRLP